MFLYHRSVHKTDDSDATVDKTCGLKQYFKTRNISFFIFLFPGQGIPETLSHVFILLNSNWDKVRSLPLSHLAACGICV